MLISSTPAVSGRFQRPVQALRFSGMVLNLRKDTVHFGATQALHPSAIAADLDRLEHLASPEEKTDVWNQAFEQRQSPQDNHQLALKLYHLPIQAQLTAFNKLLDRLDVNADAKAVAVLATPHQQIWPTYDANPMFEKSFFFPGSGHHPETKLATWNALFKKLPKTTRTVTEGIFVGRVIANALNLPLEQSLKALNTVINQVDHLPQRYNAQHYTFKHLDTFQPATTELARDLGTHSSDHERPVKIGYLIECLTQKQRPEAPKPLETQLLKDLIFTASNHLGEFEDNVAMMGHIMKHGSTDDMSSAVFHLSNVPVSQRAKTATTFLEAYDGKKYDGMRRSILTAFKVCLKTASTTPQPGEDFLAQALQNKYVQQVLHTVEVVD